MYTQAWCGVVEDWTCYLDFFQPSQRYLPFFKQHSFVLLEHSSCSPSISTYSKNCDWHLFSSILYDGYNTNYSLLEAIWPRFHTNTINQAIASEGSINLSEASAFSLPT